MENVLEVLEVGHVCFALAADLFFRVACLFFGTVSLFGGKLRPNPLVTPDSSGVLSTYSTAGGIGANNPFFQNSGTNGRTCNTCHISSSASTITPADVQDKFNRTRTLHIRAQRMRHVALSKFCLAEHC
jgi:hypothetical protein